VVRIHHSQSQAKSLRGPGALPPQFYSGKIKFVKSETDLYYPANPAAVWAKLAAGCEAETVPGGHLDMLTGDIKSLAAVLTRYVNEALRPK
jgi:hypothetical protein